MNKGAILSLLFVGLITGSYLEFEMNLARVADEEDGDDLTIVAEGVGLPPGRGTSEFADNVPQPVRGVAVEASFNSEALPDRLIVPRSAILLRGSEDRRPVLFVYEPNGSRGLAKWRYVNLGEENETHVEILAEGPEEGTVEPGEIVLVDGHHYLAHDTPIRLVEDVAAEGGRPAR